MTWALGKEKKSESPTGIESMTSRTGALSEFLCDPALSCILLGSAMSKDSEF